MRLLVKKKPKKKTLFFKGDGEDIQQQIQNIVTTSQSRQPNSHSGSGLSAD